MTSARARYWLRVVLSPLPALTAALAWARGSFAGTLYCSFCGKSQHQVRKLIAGPRVFICDECVKLCTDIIGEENKPAEW